MKPLAEAVQVVNAMYRVNPSRPYLDQHVAGYEAARVALDSATEGVENAPYGRVWVVVDRVTSTRGNADAHIHEFFARWGVY